jgi:hypothetical protein
LIDGRKSVRSNRKPLRHGRASDWGRGSDVDISTFRRFDVSQPLFQRTGKGAAGFIVRLLVYFGLLAWVPWPGLQEGYRALFIGGADGVFGTSGAGISIRFRQVSGSDRLEDVEMVVTPKGSPKFWTTPISSRVTGYLPTAAVIVLVAATPLPWPRRVRALLWAVVGVHLFILLRLAVALLYSLSVARLGPFFGAGGTWSDWIYRGLEVPIRMPTTSLVIAVLIWILATFRRDDLSNLMDARRRASFRPEGRHRQPR